MKVGGRNCIVLVTCRTLNESKKIARRVVQKRLAACVNVVLSPLNSYYTWKGRLEIAREYLLVMKTTSKRLGQLEKEVKRLHIYDVPEFIVLPITNGSRAYLTWLQQSVSQARK